MRGLVFFAITLVAFAQSCSSRAADGTNGTDVSTRTCSVRVGDAPTQPCRQLIYSRGPRPGFVDIAVNMENGQVTFSGTYGSKNTIKLSGIFNERPHMASGKCSGTIPLVGRLGAVKCVAYTDLGLVTLTSTGDDPHDIAVIIGKKIHR